MSQINDPSGRKDEKNDMVLNYVLEHLFCDFAPHLPPGLRTTDWQDVTDSPITCILYLHRDPNSGQTS
jgi:hypothetical protein